LELKPVIKFWLETDGGYIFGEGPFELLSRIQEFGTIRAAAKELGMSYRHAWGIVKTIERRIGKPILKTHKGGRLGGGGAELTEDGELLLNKYLEVKKALREMVDRLAGRLIA
jgi:molybdate transport repressor ModE-like protein